MSGVKVIENESGSWKVTLGDAELFVFGTKGEAEAFATKLHARIKAPHDLPADTCDEITHHQPPKASP